MAERGLLPFGKSYACKLLGQDPAPHKDALARRLAAAPQGAYLAVDLLKVEHQALRVRSFLPQKIVQVRLVAKKR